MSSTNQPPNGPSAYLNSSGLSLKMNWGVFGNMVDALKKSGSRKVESFINFMSSVAELKVGVDNNIAFLTAAISHISGNPCDGDDGSAFSEANTMLDELKQLSSAFDSRDKKRHNFKSIGELLKSLQSRRQKLKTILDQPLQCESLLAENVVDSSNIIESHEDVEEKSVVDSGVPRS
ncbi:hypothetical protein AgCh_029511 [Apium graveolens]